MMQFYKKLPQKHVSYYFVLFLKNGIINIVMSSQKISRITVSTRSFLKRSNICNVK